MNNDKLEPKEGFKLVLRGLHAYQDQLRRRMAELEGEKTNWVREWEKKYLPLEEELDKSKRAMAEIEQKADIADKITMVEVCVKPKPEIVREPHVDGKKAKNAGGKIMNFGGTSKAPIIVVEHVKTFITGDEWHTIAQVAIELMQKFGYSEGTGIDYTRKILRHFKKTLGTTYQAKRTVTGQREARIKPDWNKECNPEPAIVDGPVTPFEIAAEQKRKENE